ncbi:MAG TPA: hypothetical protein VG010_12475 [Solirubrobacteraceae bacterium]|nr:hypothetical protein [Solirubrobacteraceae bacterium]
MDRPRAGRPPRVRPSLARATLALLGRPLAAAGVSAPGLPRSRPRPGASGPVVPRSRSRGGASRGRRSAHDGHPSPALGLARRWLRVLWRHRRLRLGLLASLVALPLLIGGWSWLRHSSLVSVQRVRVSGATGPEAPAIEAALSGAARHMSTLDVNTRALRAAVAPFAIVREVRASASFPHGLNVHVVEQPPVATLLAGGARTAVAADGVVLGPALLSSRLPTVTGTAAPVAGARVGEGALLEALTVIGAAPGPFAKAIARVLTGPNGLTVAMRNGLLAYFGDATRPHAKWLSLARVLSDSSATGASYVDVRVPERPAAGFPSGTPPAAASASPSGTGEAGAPVAAGGSEETIAAIAAHLAGPKGSESASNPAEAATPPEPSTSPAGEPQNGSTQGESAGAKTPETKAAPAGEAAQSGGESTTKGH